MVLALYVLHMHVSLVVSGPTFSMLSDRMLLSLDGVRFMLHFISSEDNETYGCDRSGLVKSKTSPPGNTGRGKRCVASKCDQISGLMCESMQVYNAIFIV